MPLMDKIQVLLASHKDSPKTWYHISNSWRGNSLIVKPRSTIRPDTKDRRDSTPCIHVCPSIAECIIAIGSFQDYSELRVYKTKALAIPAPWVFDYSVTREHRIYEKATFTFVKTIKADELLKKGVPDLDLSGMSDNAILKNAKIVLKSLKSLGY